MGTAFIRYLVNGILQNEHYNIRFGILLIPAIEMRKGSEQGECTAKTALKILAGTSPEDILITTNKKSSIYLNTRLASELEIMFPTNLIKYSKQVK